MTQEAFLRYAAAALDIYGPGGAFEIAADFNDQAQTVAAFEGLACAVTLHTRGWLVVVPPVASLEVVPDLLVPFIKG